MDTPSIHPAEHIKPPDADAIEELNTAAHLIEISRYNARQPTSAKNAAADLAMAQAHLANAQHALVRAQLNVLARI